MNRATLHEYARDIALVTMAMIDVLASTDEDDCPNRYRYHLFNGFEGFASHAGEAGLVLAELCEGLFSDGWIEIVDDYAGRVIRHALREERPASQKLLRVLARQARDSSDNDGGAP